MTLNIVNPLRLSWNVQAAFKSSDRYGVDLNYIDLLKLIASISMIIDHVGAYFFPEYPVFRLLGRLAAPIFFFVAGLNVSSRFNVFMLVSGTLLTVLTYQVDGYLLFNILLNLLLIRYAFNHRWMQLINPKRPEVFFLICILGNAIVMNFLEYGLLGWLIAWCGYWIKKGEIKDGWLLWLSLCIFFVFNILAFSASGTTLNVWGCVIEVVTLHQLMLRYQSTWKCPCPRWVLIFARNTLWVYVIHLSGIKIFYYYEYILN